MPTPIEIAQAAALARPATASRSTGFEHYRAERLRCKIDGDDGCDIKW